MIRVGASVPPLPPMRSPMRIAETILAALREGQPLTPEDVHAIVDFRHEHGGSRVAEATLILARTLVKEQNRRAKKVEPEVINRIMVEVTRAKAGEHNGRLHLHVLRAILERVLA